MDQAKVKTIWEYWNKYSPGIKCIVLDGRAKYVIIQKLQQGWTVELITQAIQNYAYIQQNNRYYNGKVWTLVEFLTQDNTLPVFIDLEGAKKRYCKQRGGLL